MRCCVREFPLLAWLCVTLNLPLVLRNVILLANALGQGCIRMPHITALSLLPSGKCNTNCLQPLFLKSVQINLKWILPIGCLKIPDAIFFLIADKMEKKSRILVRQGFDLSRSSRKSICLKFVLTKYELETQCTSALTINTLPYVQSVNVQPPRPPLPPHLLQSVCGTN